MILAPIFLFWCVPSSLSLANADYLQLSQEAFPDVSKPSGSVMVLKNLVDDPLCPKRPHFHLRASIRVDQK